MGDVLQLIDDAILLNKKYCKKANKDLESIRDLVGKNNKKRPLEEEKKTEESADFVCAGHIWKEPPTPCPGGERSKIKETLRYKCATDPKAKIYVICKGCKNAYVNDRKKRRKEEKKAETN